MFVPFIFTMDTYDQSENYFHWAHFHWYAAACIKNKWPIISHERYFKRFSNVEEVVFGIPLQDVLSYYCVNSVPTTEDMLALKVYPVSQTKEDALIATYASQFDCWVDLLKNENSEFEQIIGELLDKVINDFGEKPEGILVFEFLPKALLRAANKREIPVIFQGGGVLRPPFTPVLNAFSLINGNSAEMLKSKYERFISENTGVPMLTHKGILRLFTTEQYIMDIHNIDNEPEYDVGVIYNSGQVALYHTGQEYVSDQEMSDRAKARYDRVLIRTRPGYEPTTDALDGSPTCFHFCCKCKHVLGFATKGMFEAMLAGRIAHEYGSFIFHSFCNHGIEDDSKSLVSIEFLNFVMFGLCTPFTWLTDPDYLRFLLSNPSEKELYLRNFNYFTQNISKEDLKLYYMSSERKYRLSDPLYFTSGHKQHEYAAYYCTGGLHSNEGFCTWSNGESTSFEFDLTEPINEPLTISVALYGVAMDLDSQNPAQTVTCEVGGINCGSIILTPGKKYMRFTIPAECFTDKLQVTFRYGYLHTSGDFKIAVAFERMHISRIGQRMIEDSMSDEIASLANKASVLEAQISEQESQNSELRTQNSELESYNSELRTQNSELESHNFELRTQNSGLESHNSELRTQNSELESHNSELRMQNSELESHNSELRTQNSKLESHKSELRIQNSELESHNSELKTQISGLEAQIQLIYNTRSWKLGNGIMKIATRIVPRKYKPHD